MRRAWVAGLRDGLLDLLYPRSCPGCGADSDRPARWVCWECARAVEPLHDPVCSRCGDKPSGRIEHDFICGACRAAPPAYDRARSAVRFHGVIRDLLLAFKYDAATWLCEDLGDFLEAAAVGMPAVGPDAVTAIPLYPGRARTRGYNQSELLARSLARRLGRPYLTVLRRARDTRSQTALNGTERRRNVRGAFAPAAPARIHARSWFLVDDVMTTGATLGEAARVLRACGARQVVACTVARGG